jgi:hypothetical protein
VAGATRLVARASGTSLDGGVCFPSEFSIIASAFALGQVLHFGSQAYVADCYGELHLLNGFALVESELPALPPPPGRPREQISGPRPSGPSWIDHRPGMAGAVPYARAKLSCGARGFPFTP